MRHSATVWRFGSQITPSLRVMLPEGHVHFQEGETLVWSEPLAAALIRQMPDLPGVSLLAVGRTEEQVPEFDDSQPEAAPRRWWQRG